MAATVIMTTAIICVMSILWGGPNKSARRTRRISGDGESAVRLADRLAADHGKTRVKEGDRFYQCRAWYHAVSVSSSSRGVQTTACSSQTISTSRRQA